MAAREGRKLPSQGLFSPGLFSVPCPSLRVFQRLRCLSCIWSAGSRRETGVPVLARFPTALWGAEESRTQVFELMDRERAVYRDMWRMLCCFSGESMFLFPLL